MLGFERTREDGVPLPDLRRVGAVEQRLIAQAQQAQQAQRPAVTRTTQARSVRYTNHCMNGNCVRTFADGRKERWQAPRVYNPHKQDWEWETGSCGG